MTAVVKQRATGLRKRRALDEDQREKRSHRICKQVVASRLFRSANRIACYLPMADEVDPRFVIACAWRANKRVFIPVVRDNGRMDFIEIRPETTLRKNSMSIWEPDSGARISPRMLQFVITPTVAFDRQLHRIGMGGGYYDRCFSHLRHRKQWVSPKLAGVAFDCQEVEKITPNTWDIRLYRIFTA